MSYYESKMYVRCSACGESHDTKKVEFTNVEEDMEGRDVVTFVCPDCKKETTSLVRRSPW